MKMILMSAVLLSGFAAAPALSQVVDSDGAGQPAPAGNCLAVERATRNSKGGDRQQGIFGAAQESFTALFDRPEGFTWNETGITYYDYGQFLQDWRAKYCGA